MKRKFSKILFLFGIMNVFAMNINAFELTYSQWSETYPENIKEIFIESEDRFYWYKENIVDVEYLIKEDINNKLFDENDFKYYTSEELLERPVEYSERIINETNKMIEYTSSDIKGIYLTTNDSIQISEIDIRDNLGNRIMCNNENNKLFDDDISIYYEMYNELYCYFDEKLNINDFSTFLCMKSDSNNKVTFNFNLITENNDIIYYTNSSFLKSAYYIEFGKNVLRPNLFHSKTYYTYTDKLYKTYNIEKEYINEYYSNLDGYIKDESSKKTFYRYITNDYIIVDENDNIVTNESHCNKEFCKIIYLNNNEQIDNPKTYDGINKLTILLISSIIILIIIVKKCHMN